MINSCFILDKLEILINQGAASKHYIIYRKCISILKWIWKYMFMISYLISKNYVRSVTKVSRNTQLLDIT